jgi:hypothetical protein
MKQFEIIGRVFEDVNNDGVKDEDEPWGLTGGWTVTVDLLQDDGTEISSTITDATSGEYEFLDLRHEGEYKLLFETPHTDYTFSTTTEGEGEGVMTLTKDQPKGTFNVGLYNTTLSSLQLGAPEETQVEEQGLVHFFFLGFHLIWYILFGLPKDKPDSNDS